MTNVNELYSNGTLHDLMKTHTAVADTSALLIRGVDLLKSMPPRSRIVIPAIVVSELEGLRNSDNVGFLAREWLRLLETLRIAFETKLGTPEGVLEDGIYISVEPNNTNQESLPKSLQNGSADSTILAVAKNISEKRDIPVLILSNDTPMRLHATLELAIPAFEISGATLDDAAPFSGIYEASVGDEDVDSVVSGRFSVGMLSDEDQDFVDRQSNLVVRVKHSGETIGTFIVSESGVEELPRTGNRLMNVAPKTFEQHAASFYLKKRASELPIVSIGGGAGTGKTLLAVAAGLESIKQGHYSKIIVFRSLHEMGVGQEMGFLPGGVDEKIEPWAGAVYDAVDVIARKKSSRGSEDKVQTLIDGYKESIEVSPITYLRGRSITDAYMILDEAQNFSRKELLNIISRVGDGTKVVLCFDANQVDNRFIQSGTRAEIWSLIESLRSSELFAHVTLHRTERSATAELAASLLA